MEILSIVFLYHIVSSYLRCNLAETAIEIKASLAREPEHVSKWFQLIHHENPIESKVSIIFYQTQDQGDFYLLCMISQSFDTFFVFEENHILFPSEIVKLLTFVIFPPYSVDFACSADHICRDHFCNY